MAYVWCTFTYLEAQYFAGEEFQPQHAGILWEKVIDWMLFGSAHAVPLYVGWRRWQSAARLLANSLSQLMHLKPNACTTAGPDARIGMNLNWWFLAGCAFKSHHNVRYSTEIDQWCIQKYALHWWIECASNVISAVTWSSGGIYIQEHWWMSAIEKSKISG